MCGRFTLATTKEIVREVFHVERVPKPEGKYNIAPTQSILGIRVNARSLKREAVLFHWGLIPSWAKEHTIGSRTINARAESLTTKPSFKAPFRRRRCLIPASGFYEWKRLKDKTKQPYYFLPKSEGLFAFGGLWDHWQGRDGTEIESCTIITVPANELVEPVHDRMPLIIEPEKFDLWLNPKIHMEMLVTPLLKPYSVENMESYPVNSVVNKPTFDSLDCILPI